MDQAYELEATSTLLYDDYSVWFVPFWKTRAFLIMLLLLLAVLATFIIFFIIRVVRRRALVKKTPVWTWALQQLAMLKKQCHDMTEQDVYVQLTWIIKSYVQERYKISVLDKPDQKVMEMVPGGVVSEECEKELCEIFERAVLIKFARKDSVVGEMLQDVSSVEHFIQETMPVKRPRDP